MNASGLNVVITGASAGVGRAVAWRFARAGARVGLIARDEAALVALAREMEDSIDATAVAAPADVGDADQLHAAAEHIEQKLGPADIWVNCAMLRSEERR